MIPNINPVTNIAYGYVSASELDSGLVDQLFFETGIDLSFQQWQRENPEADPDDYNNDEAIIEGTFEGVKYRTSWMGGALHLFILESPHITDKADLASPCVPNCGILSKDMDGSVESYSVPDDWWGEDYA